MTNLDPTLTHPQKSSPQAAAALNTSLLLEDLRRIYERDGKCVEVDFRSMVHWIRVGDQLTHQIHPYPAKLLPHIAHFFAHSIPKTSVPNCVLDPFCGSGTVALEASLAQCPAYVADANPLARLITKVKTTPYDTAELREATRMLVGRAKRLRSAPPIDIVNGQKWYHSETKKQLELLLRAITETDNDAHRDFFHLCFSVAARRLSNSDPAISVPVQLRCKPKFSESVNEKISKRLEWIANTKPVDEFYRICHANIDRIEQTNKLEHNRQPAKIISHDARKLYCPESNFGLTDNSVPLIITSPPYGSAQKYIRASSLSLNWLNFASPKDLSTLEGQSIGREHVPAYQKISIGSPLPSSYEDFLKAIGAQNQLREKITRQYLIEMREALIEMARVTAVGGRIVLIIGNNHVAGRQLKNDEFIEKILSSRGCKLELSLLDQIKSRGLLTKRNSTAGVITRERIMVFRKA